MLPLQRIVRKPPGALLYQITNPSLQPRRFAHSSYGNEQSGHQQDKDAPNPKAHLEHPGPEAPDTKSSSSSPSSSDSSSTSSSVEQNKSSGAKPAIHHPKSAAEKEDPEVRKHNEDMKHRSEQTTNQLSEKDNKVDKQFWKGDVGHSSKK